MGLRIGWPILLRQLKIVSKDPEVPPWVALEEGAANTARGNRLAVPCLVEGS